MPNRSTQDALGPLTRGLSQSGVRLANERAILTLVAVKPGISNAELARSSGLGPQTTSRILSDLENQGLILRGEVLRGRRGQPATPYALNAEGAFTIGIEVNWRHCEVLLLDFTGTRRAELRKSYDYPDARTMVGELSSAVHAMLKALSADQRGKLLGIGLAMPTRMEKNIAHLATEEQGALWRELDLVEELAHVTGLRVERIATGAAGCFAEMNAQVDRGKRGFVYLHVGTYLCSGLMYEGQLVEGPTGNGAALGSMVVPGPGGRMSFAGIVASITELERRLAEAGRPVPKDDPVTWDWVALEPVASEWIDATAYALAQLIMNTQAVSETNHALVNGSMPRPLVARLVEATMQAMGDMPGIVADRPVLEAGRIERSAAAIGAAHRLAYNTYFSRAWKLLAT